MYTGSINPQWLHRARALTKCKYLPVQKSCDIAVVCAADIRTLGGAIAVVWAVGGEGEVLRRGRAGFLGRRGDGVGVDLDVVVCGEVSGWVGGREGLCLLVQLMDISVDRFFLGGGRPARPAHRRHRRLGA
jgi:hypothetical protein